MSVVVISRPPREPGPAMPEGQLEIQEPPPLVAAPAMDLGTVMTFLPMLLMAGSMAFMYSGGGGGVRGYLGPGMMGLAMAGMMFGQVGRGTGERKRRLRTERRDYMRYLTQIRKPVRAAIDQQRAAVMWNHPAPQSLWSLAMGRRLWERRPGHADFTEVRVGMGSQRSRLRLVPPQTKPVEDLEPMCAGALRRFLRTYAAVPDVPTALYLPGLPSIALCGDPDRLRGLLRAMLAQLATFHSPEDLRIAVLAADPVAAQWEWAKWLPHAAHPSDADSAGPVRMFATAHSELFALLGRSGTDSDGGGRGVPFTTVLVDGVAIPADSPLLAMRRGSGVLLDLLGPVPDEAELPHGSRLVLREDVLTAVAEGAEINLGAADEMTESRCEALARVLSPLRTAGSIDATEALTADFDMTRLLGIRDVHRYDVQAFWRARARAGAFRVPIGLGEDGSVIELDIKEAAQGGMGPHGMLIGATGSGKSELLRTLVVTLATTHSSEQLNLVLIDFKGGATFLGLERLPHTAAVITNLADELTLVDRMQAALHGELIRRQELLRQHGYSSASEYEKARAKGAELSPLPTLFIVVDEFSELLASKPEFIQLFVMIGRLGRSLGVHLLLASQRLDEGRIHSLEGHLSYRLALRTFSAIESRSIIGSALAYELPSQPGSGYLKYDTTTLVRFKAGYVSGPAPATARATSPGVLPSTDVVPFTATYQIPQAPTVGDLPEPIQADDDATGEQSLMAVLVNRLAECGPPARQVWLPPLEEPPGLDEVLPGVMPDPTRGLTSVDWKGSGQLRAPIGVIDRPFEQLRELLVADLNGATGHVAVVGGPVCGKSTLVRTLMMSLALTHTPEELQFYCLDFGGGSLATLVGLPHVGDVATRMDRDKVRRTVAEMAALLERRERSFAESGVDSIEAYRRLRSTNPSVDPFGDVFLVIDGWFTLRNDFDDIDAIITEIAARGLGYGLHLIIAASRWSEIRPSVRDHLGTRYELRLGDPLDSEIGSRAAATVPQIPGRGILKDGGHFLIALPRIDGAHDASGLAEATRSVVQDIAELWTGASAHRVRMLPHRIVAAELPSGDQLAVSLGIDERRLEAVLHDFAATPHLMCFGDAQTGKTNLLRLVAEAIINKHDPTEVRFALGDPRRGLHDSIPEEYRVGYAVTGDALSEVMARAAHSLTKRVPSADVTPEQLRMRNWWTGPELFVLVDDYELAATEGQGPLSPLLRLLPQGADIGLHVVVARSSSSAMRAVMDPVVRRLWEMGTPALLFSYPKEEGKFLGEAGPRLLPPGRAQLVTRRDVRIVQTGFVSQDDTSFEERDSA